MNGVKKYRPSNDSEGAAFVAGWCGSCEHGRPNREPCDIVARTMWLDVDHPDYPEEWQVCDEGAVCIAHVEIGGPDKAARCDRTVDMFKEGK